MNTILAVKVDDLIAAAKVDSALVYLRPATTSERQSGIQRARIDEHRSFNLLGEWKELGTVDLSAEEAEAVAVLIRALVGHERRSTA